MSVEITSGGYLHSFDSEALPRIKWQEMFDRKIVYAPHVVLNTLTEAEQVLVTHPGPNLDRRKVLAPEWFSYWKDLLQTGFNLNPTPSFISSEDKFVKFDNLAAQLSRKYSDQSTGMLFVAGAEGHKGHIHAARYMKSIVPVTIWGFEQSSYMQKKIRQAPFLPLELRLSMWFYNPDLNHITVLPGNTTEVSDNEHYDDLFTASGAKYFFVHERDPNITEKLRRGGQDLERTINHPYPDLSTTDDVQELMPELSLEQMRRMLVFSNQRIIPDMATERTTDRVKRLWPGYSKQSSRLVLRVPPNIEDFFGYDTENSLYYDRTFQQ